MIVKMQITFDYNPETNEYTPLKQEIIKETKSVIKTESSEPQITLTDNKYIINDSTAELLNVKYGDRLEIKYQVIDKVSFPIIGKSEYWGSTGGNKLTKSLTVSYRGQANELLSEYGNIFTLTPWKDHEGLYVLMGNKIRTTSDENIQITENYEPEVDLTTEVDTPIIEEEFSEIELEKTDDETYEISDFDFEL